MAHALTCCFNRDRVILRDAPFSTGRHSSGGRATGIPAGPLLLASCTGRKDSRIIDSVLSCVLSRSFWQPGHGNPVDQAARLDCYSRFRVDLALDHELDPVFRKEMERHLDSL